VHVRGEKVPLPVVDQVTEPVGEFPVTVAVHEMYCPTMRVVEGEHPIVVVVDVSATAGPALTRRKNPESRRSEKAHQMLLMLVLLLPRASPS
jgi:hypothetical protein